MPLLERAICVFTKLDRWTVVSLNTPKNTNEVLQLTEEKLANHYRQISNNKHDHLTLQEEGRFDVVI